MLSRAAKRQILGHGARVLKRARQCPPTRGSRRSSHADAKLRGVQALPRRSLMPAKVTRRDFLAAAAGVTTAGLAGCFGGDATCMSDANGLVCALPEPKEAPFDAVVVLMMENRSFDHMLGWLPGANGRQQGLTYVDEAGVAHATWPLAPDFQGCQYQDPDHTWEGIAIQYANGACDGFLKTRTDPDRDADLFPIGYYRQEDLPILSTLATAYTTFDNYFCSMQ